MRSLLKSNRWYAIIIKWELGRVVYNIIMCGIGWASFYIGYVTTPLVYLLIGLAFNIVYTFGLIVELVALKKLSLTAREIFQIHFFSIPSLVSNVGVWISVLYIYMMVKLPNINCLTEILTTFVAGTILKQYLKKII